MGLHRRSSICHGGNHDSCGWFTFRFRHRAAVSITIGARDRTRADINPDVRAGAPETVVEYRCIEHIRTSLTPHGDSLCTYGSSGLLSTKRSAFVSHKRCVYQRPDGFHCPGRYALGKNLHSYGFCRPRLHFTLHIRLNCRILPPGCNSCTCLVAYYTQASSSARTHTRTGTWCDCRDRSGVRVVESIRSGRSGTVYRKLCKAKRHSSFTTTWDGRLTKEF